MRRPIRMLCVAAVCSGLLACDGVPTRPSVALVETVHAQAAPGDGFRFPDGAGMYSEGRWLFIRGGNGAQYGPVGIGGTVHLTTLTGSGVRRLCVDGSNAVVACDASDTASEVAALRREVQELRASVASLSHR